jgi:hypothetical protein
MCGLLLELHPVGVAAQVGPVHTSIPLSLMLPQVSPSLLCATCWDWVIALAHGGGVRCCQRLGLPPMHTSRGSSCSSSSSGERGGYPTLRAACPPRLPARALLGPPRLIEGIIAFCLPSPRALQSPEAISLCSSLPFVADLNHHCH